MDNAIIESYLQEISNNTRISNLLEIRRVNREIMESRITDNTTVTSLQQRYKEEFTKAKTIVDAIDIVLEEYLKKY